jgi:hypothetical protein
MHRAAGKVFWPRLKTAAQGLNSRDNFLTDLSPRHFSTYLSTDFVDYAAGNPLRCGVPDIFLSGLPERSLLVQRVRWQFAEHDAVITCKV